MRKWPGAANLSVSLVFIAKGWELSEALLDGRRVGGITAGLKELVGEGERPIKLRENGDLCFTGPEILGDGFLLEAETAKRMVAADRPLGEVLRPYLTGVDITSQVGLEARRWVINFGDRSLEQAARYAELLKIVRERVKPKRMKSKNEGHRERWWQFGSNAQGMKGRIAGLKRVFICSLTAKYFAFEVCEPHEYEFSILVKVFAFESWGAFGFLSSSIHDLWAKEYCSTLEDRLRYTSTEIFDTLPFPKGFEVDERLVPLGEEFYVKRRRVQVARGLSLTKFYNAFHDEKEAGKAFVELRGLLRGIDERIMQLYGWVDVDLGHGFHETAQGVRFTLCERARREVHRRMLEKNLRTIDN